MCKLRKCRVARNKQKMLTACKNPYTQLEQHFLIFSAPYKKGVLESISHVKVAAGELFADGQPSLTLT